MQTRAVIRAAINVNAKHPDWNVTPEIMIPLVCEIKELVNVKKVVVEAADEEIKAAGVAMNYKVGTKIEIPRAALTADEIAKEAEFFCFGTNDLTQMTFVSQETTQVSSSQLTMSPRSSSPIRSLVSTRTALVSS